MPVEIIYAHEDYIDSFWQCLDTVAKERRWLGSMQAPAIEKIQKFVLGMIENDNAQYFAVDNGRVVGWVDISPSTLSIALHVGSLGMGLLAEYRGQGIGKALMSAAIEKAKSRGLKRIELQVYPHNTAAISLYQRMGFIEEGRCKNAVLLDEGYIDLLMMALWLG